MRNATLLFLIKKTNGQITDICLAMKKRGFGQGRWNGVGGKVEGSESIENAAIREAQEEIGVTAKDLTKVAELTFTFPHKSDWDQVVHAYFSENWEGEPTESEEMAPKWFPASLIPLSQMWPSDIYWVPQVIAGALAKGRVTFGENDTILKQEVNIVTNL